MIIPNKVTSYKESIISKLPIILEKLVEKETNIQNLYFEVEKDFSDINEYILVLDVLFVLDSIELDEGKRSIRYVKANNMW